MLFRHVATSAAVTLLCAVIASAQVSFSTHTYPNNNLWSTNEGRNGHLSVDLNGDGREDFVSGVNASFNSGCAGSFAVVLSQGDGSYGAPVCYSLPSGVALFFATGDFDATGTMDLVVTNERGDAWVFTNNGNGQLTINNHLSLAGEAGGIVAADVNRDGHIDLVYDVPNPTSNTQALYVLLGNSPGYPPGGVTFTEGPTTTFSNPEPPGALLAGDFDGDGRTDILSLGVSQVVNQVFWGDGTGHFTAGASFGPQQAYAPADINSDGTLSLIGMVPTASGYSNTLDLEHGHYNRAFTSQHVTLKHCAIGGDPVMADFNGDGHNDIVVAEDADCKGNGPYTLNFLRNLNNGTTTPTFAAEQVIYSTSDYIWQWHTLRASHSSRPDLTVWQSVYTNNTISNPEQLVLVNTTSGSFPCTPLNFRATGISLCGPTSNVVASSPVNMSFAGSNESPGRDMEIWVDGKKVDQAFSHAYSYYDFMNASVPMSNGQHTVDVYSVGWDYSVLFYRIPLSVGSNTCAPPSYQGITICSPLHDAVVGSPVSAWAAANGAGSPITRMEVWVDGVKQYSTFGSNTLKTQITLAPGNHQFDFYLVLMSGPTYHDIDMVQVK
jgi:hypothetical protein